MNFLAHAYLSFGEPEVLIGNFIGDFVRGPLEDFYDKKIIVGIHLHREIDRFTDLHPVVKKVQTILKPEYGRYSSVITDLYFDYFLGRYWENYHDQPLHEFADKVYETIESYRKVLPQNFLNTFHYMREHDWLYGYSKIGGIQKALTGLSKRASFVSKMETAHLFLEKHHDYFKINFIDFFEDLVTYSKQRLEHLKSQI